VGKTKETINYEEVNFMVLPVHVQFVYFVVCHNHKDVTTGCKNKENNIRKNDRY